MGKGFIKCVCERFSKEHTLPKRKNMRTQRRILGKKKKKKKKKNGKTFHHPLLPRTAQGHKLIKNRGTKRAQSLVFSLVLLTLYVPLLAQVV